MRTTTTALALASTLLAAPAAAEALKATDPPYRAEAVDAHKRAARRSDLQQELIQEAARLARRAAGDAVRLARRVADARGEHFAAAAERRRLRGKSLDVVKQRVRDLRRDLQEAHAQAQAPAPAPSASPTLQAIAACESGGNPAAVGGGGAYRGKYQFSFGTWASVGGTGDPAAASEAEQDLRAAMLYARAGASPWPVCGR